MGFNILFHDFCCCLPQEARETQFTSIYILIRYVLLHSHETATR